MSPPEAQITIETPAGAFQIVPERSAVIVVDMQNDFGSPGGMFHRDGIDVSQIRATIEPTARVLKAAREAGVKIVYLKMGFLSDLSDAGPPDGPNRRAHMRWGVGESVPAPDGSESRILIRDTWNTDIVAELAPAQGDVVVYKHRFSGFFETELHETLQRLGVTQLIFTGCTTSVCVESTVRDAMFRDYDCLLLEDCMAEPQSRKNHDATLMLMEAMFARVSRSADFVAALERQPAAAS